MNPNCDVCDFLLQKPLQNQILTTEYWTVGIIPDQPYLGRALVTSLSHKSSLGQLTDEEWSDFQTIVRRLEPAYANAFGANPLNMGCFMNHGFRDDPPHPHVHWQIFPRYKQTVEFAGLVFEDKLYGSFYDDAATRPVDNDVVEQIVERLKASLN
jgi:diadenosine tetraphosphate (Ap4A) HIT family hydrolase